MSQQYDFTIAQPVSIWNRELKISPKEFFSALGKSVVDGVTFNFPSLGQNLIDVLNSITPKEKPAISSWVLIYRSVLRSISVLVDEYKDLITTDIVQTDVDKFADELSNALNKIEVGINKSFFDSPQQLPFLDDMKPALVDWLKNLGLAEIQAEAFHLRLKQYFVLSLHFEWLDKQSEYSCIQDALSSPFTKATQQQRDWMQYNAWLQEQANERMFAEAFSLKQVYVPLRAYYKETINEKQEHEQTGEGKAKKVVHVVDLHDEMESWLRNFDDKSAVRVICGGPGSGKSSFSKMFAAYVAEHIKDVPVLFIPLHHFDPKNDLTSAVEQFIKDNRYLSDNPLDASNGKERLLIIFDGLDELAMQGKAAEETANYFVEEVISKINHFNNQNLERQVLITGRDIAISSVSNKLRSDKQVFHVLPYVVPEHKETFFGLSYEYQDDCKLLDIDQRDTWWANYGKAKGLDYKNIPEELKLDKLTPITREPLLNYLVALSYERSEIEFSDNTSLNEVYQDLLHAVHDRQWESGKHKATANLDNKKFERILEEIALAVWHGHGRTASVNAIDERCQKSGLDKSLKEFEQSAKQGVSRLLTAFYFKQSESSAADGDKTFEFTHKSFGEYLTAKRIVRSVKQIHSGLMRNEEEPGEGIDEQEALKRWAEICGPTRLDQYVFHFLCDEIQLYPEKLAGWQQTFARLLGVAVRQGMPMEQAGIAKFSEMMRQSRNAEEALLVAHYACAKVTQKVINMDWGESHAFGTWLKRIQGQRSFFANNLVLYCLAWLDLSAVSLILQDFHNANLEGANLKEADLRGAYLREANLIYAILEDADLREADLIGADLRGADLRGADLREADLRGADLRGADLRGADLRQANLSVAYLIGANLKGVKLMGADQTGADLRGADLRGADLRGADLRGADLRQANLRGADLREANLIGADLIDAILEGVDLRGANLRDANQMELI